MSEADEDLARHDLWTLIALLTEQKQKKFWNTRASYIRSRLEAGADPNTGRENPLTLAADIGHLDLQVKPQVNTIMQGHR